MQTDLLPKLYSEIEPKNSLTRGMITLFHTVVAAILKFSFFWKINDKCLSWFMFRSHLPPLIIL